MPAHRQNNGNMKARIVACNPVPHQDLIQLQQMLDKMNCPLDQKTNKESTDKHPVQCHEMEESEEMRGWEKFRQLAREGLDTRVTSDLLRDMELVDGDSEPDIDISEDMELTKKVFQCNSIKRNLYDDLEKCVDTLEEGNNEGKVAPADKKKTKWGPQLACERPRRGANDSRTILQKATDLKSLKNLDGTKKNTGTSFNVFDSDYLAQISHNVGINLGNDTKQISANIDSIKCDDTSRSTSFISDHPEITLPVHLDIENVTTVDSSNKPENKGSEIIQPALNFGKETWSQVVQRGTRSVDNNCT